MTLQDCYRILGGDYLRICRRFTEPFIRQLIFVFMDDPTFDLMERAIRCGDGSAAYIYLTSLWDAALNLSFTPLATALCALSSLLNSGGTPPCVVAESPQFREVKREYLKTVNAITQYRRCFTGT